MSLDSDFFLGFAVCNLWGQHSRHFPTAMGVFDKVFQAWFATCLVTGLLVTRFWCELIHLVPFWSLDFKESLSNRVLGLGLRCVLATQCQIRVDMDEESRSALAEINRTVASGRGTSLLVNHSSYLDGLLVGMTVPLALLGRGKTYMMNKQFKTPLVGRLWKLTGQLPVYFKSNEYGKFSVDQDRQKAVTQRVTRFTKSGGTLIYCPEGQVNKSPRELLPFRRGSFKGPAESGLDMYAFVHLNNDKMWPRKQPIGGLPSTIRIRVRKLRAGGSESKASAADLADQCREEMQTILDGLLELEETKKGR